MFSHHRCVKKATCRVCDLFSRENHIEDGFESGINEVCVGEMTGPGIECVPYLLAVMRELRGVWERKWDLGGRLHNAL